MNQFIQYITSSFWVFAGVMAFTGLILDFIIRLVK